MGYIPTRRYASGAEILHHLEAIADEFDLVPDALFHTGVTQARWSEDRGRWQISTDRGDELNSRWYVLAAGILNLLKLPTIPGMDEFAGRLVPHGTVGLRVHGWRAGCPLTGLEGKVVALVGTGATGIQCVPPLAESAKHLYVLQRTPSAIGERNNRPTEADFGKRLEPGGSGPGWTTSSPS